MRGPPRPPKAQGFQVFSEGIPAVSWYISLINSEFFYYYHQSQDSTSILDLADLTKKKVIVSLADIYQPFSIYMLLCHLVEFFGTYSKLYFLGRIYHNLTKKYGWRPS